MLQVGSRLERAVLSGIIKEGDAGGLFRIGEKLQICTRFVIDVTEAKSVAGGTKDKLADFKKAHAQCVGKETTKSL